MTSIRTIFRAAALTAALSVAACATPSEEASSGFAPGSSTRLELGGYYAMAGGAIVGRH